VLYQAEPLPDGVRLRFNAQAGTALPHINYSKREPASLWFSRCLLLTGGLRERIKTAQLPHCALASIVPADRGLDQSRHLQRRESSNF
jgi:hypothetical protein